MKRRHRGKSSSGDADEAASARIKARLREIEMQKETLEANWDKNFEDFSESLALFETERNSFETQVECEIHKLAQKDPEPDPLVGQRLVYQYGIAKKKAAEPKKA